MKASYGTVLRAVGSGIVVFVFGLGGCSFALRPSSKQCDTDGDCAAKGPEFEGTLCSPDHVCLSNAAYCFNNAQCVHANGEQPYFCRKTDHTCQALLTADCPRVTGSKGGSSSAHDALLDDNVIIIGNMGTRILPYPTGALNSTELAREDFVTAISTLPPKGPGQPRQPVVFVECDCNTPPCATDTSKHLIEDLGAPAIIGWPLSQTLVAAASAEILPNHVLAASGASNNEAVRKLPDRADLIWEFQPGDDVALTALAVAVRDYDEGLVRSRNSIPAGTAIKVELLKSDQYGDAFAQSLTTKMTFNGKSVPQNQLDGNYVELPYGSPLVNPDDPRVAAAINQTVKEKPNIIIVGGGDDINTVATQIEAQWPNDGTPRPFWQLGTIGAGEWVSTDELRTRVVGITPGGSQTTDDWLLYRTHYAGSEFGAGLQTGESALTYLSAATYDAAYFVLYGIIANGDRPLTGSNLADAFMHKLKGGAQKFTVGQEDLTNVVSALQAGGTVDLQCVAGPCDFDANGRLPQGNAGIWCLDPDKSKPFRIMDSGIVYNGATGALEGKNTCF